MKPMRRYSAMMFWRCATSVISSVSVNSNMIASSGKSFFRAAASVARRQADGS